MSWTVATYALLALTLLVGLAWYERQRPSSRVLAAVATLAGLAALGRIAFAPLPDVKPTTTIVVLSGYALGGAPGFAIGAFAAVASNVFFGEGPWTPWQMLGWGLAGILGALLARVAGRELGRLPLALACGAAALAFGLLLDFSTWITYTGELTWRRFAAIETSALPFNVTHIAASVAFCLAFGPTLVRALLRFRARLDVRWLTAATVTALALAASATAATGGAARYLASAQNADGGFGAQRGAPSAQLYTAWAVLGLGAADADAQGRARAGHYLVANLAQLQGAGDVERTVLALAAVPRVVPRSLIGRLSAAQGPDGSFGGQVNLTAFGILALRAAGRPATDQGIVRATRWLAAQQDSDGGFGFARRGPASDVDDTGGAIQALVAGGAGGATLARAVAYIAGAQNGDGGFPMSGGGDSNAQTTAWALQGLLAARARPSVRARADAYLRGLARADGSIRYSRTSSQTPVWVTAQALAALAARPLPVIGRAPARRVVARTARPPSLPTRTAPATTTPPAGPLAARMCAAIHTALLAFGGL